MPDGSAVVYYREVKVAPGALNLDVLGSGLATVNPGAQTAVRDPGLLFAAPGPVFSAGGIEVDGQVCVLTAMIDITPRVRAEQALRESDRRFAQAFNANPLPMTITSVPEGRHLAVNDAAVRHSGYAREEMLGRTTVELGMWADPEERERLMDAMRADGGARDFEMVWGARAATPRPAESFEEANLV